MLWCLWSSILNDLAVWKRVCQWLPTEKMAFGKNCISKCTRNHEFAWHHAEDQVFTLQDYIDNWLLVADNCRFDFSSVSTCPKPAENYDSDLILYTCGLCIQRQMTDADWKLCMQAVSFQPVWNLLTRAPHACDTNEVSKKGPVFFHLYTMLPLQ